VLPSYFIHLNLNKFLQTSYEEAQLWGIVDR